MLGPAPPVRRYPLTFAIFGGVLWLAIVAWFHPSPLDSLWAAALLLLAPLVLVPLALRLVHVEPEDKWQNGLLTAVFWLQLPSALLLAKSFLFEQGLIAGLLALPWLLTTALIATLGLLRICKIGIAASGQLCVNFGLLYLVIGGGWTVLSRFGIKPLEFEPIIVLLTGIHFHYAGLVLPLTAGLAIEKHPTPIARFTGLGILGSVPAVALGITTSQLGLDRWPECLAAQFMAVFGLFAAVLHLSLVFQSKWKGLARALWAGGALALGFGMVLASLYGLRYFVEIQWLDIPLMRALHGTANALGFSLPALVAWNMVSQMET